MRLSAPQQQIIDMERYGGEGIGTVCGSILVPGSCDLSKTMAAVHELYRINEALRIRLVWAAGQVTQEVAPFQEAKIEVLQMATVEELKQYAQNYAALPLKSPEQLSEVCIVILPGHFGLLTKLHHVVGDAWALALLGSQFLALLRGEEIKGYPYSEYVEAESAYYQSSRFQRDKDFFISQFIRLPEPTYLADIKGTSFNAKRCTFLFDKGQTAAINSYVAERHCTVFTLFMTVLATYFSRVKMNQNRFYLGTAILNRTNVREKNTVGMFVNTAPLLVELDYQKSFADNLIQLGDGALALFRHQKFNYGELLNVLKADYGFKGPLYDITFSYQNAAIVSDQDYESCWYSCGRQVESLQLHLEDRDREGVFRFHFDYQIDKFSQNDIESLFNCFSRLLFSAIAADDKKLFELELLSKDEKAALLTAVNCTAAEFPQDASLPQLFEQQVAKTPDSEALAAGDATLTFTELNKLANRIGWALSEKGVGRGDIVPIILPRQSYLFAAILGVLKCGAAYLPIDPDYPTEKIAYMIEDSKARFTVSAASIGELLTETRSMNLDVAVPAADPCYVIYTSGSTGKPKGAIISHRNVVNFVSCNEANRVQLFMRENCNSCVCQTTVSFDCFINESFLPLVNGLRVILADEEQSRCPKALNRLLRDHPAEMIATTPTKLKMLLADSPETAFVGRFRLILLGGEVLDPNLMGRISSLTAAAVFNAYGPTETTVFSTAFGPVRGEDIHIGRPIANTQIYIVDKYCQLLPRGVVGELCIGGQGVGAGYLQRPELNGQKFVANPFGPGTLYRTGDLTAICPLSAGVMTR